MPANDFEKKAKQLLDEVSIRPNEQVWIEVEKRIRERKRRRWFIILPLIAGLMLGGYFIARQYNVKNDKREPFTITGHIAKAQDAAKTDSYKKPGETIAVKNNKKQEAINPVFDKKSFQKLHQTDNNQQKNKSAWANVVTKDNISKSKFETNTRAVKKQKTGTIKPENYEPVTGPGNIAVKRVVRPEADKKTEIIIQPANNNTADNKLIKAEEKDTFKLSENKSEKKSIKTDSVFADNIPVAAKISLADSTASFEKAAVNKKSRQGKNNWNLGLMFNAGVSNVSNQFFSLDLNKNNEEKALANLSTGGPSAPTYYYPSSNYKAFAFEAGAFVQKEISKRSIISIGLNYSLYQTKIKTGNFVYATNVQASNSIFYANVRPGNAAAGSIDYHSKLQYFELPVNYAVRLTRNKKLPFYWNGGISAGLLLGSNYLHYDTASQGIYFKDNSLLRKVSFNLQTGIGFTLASNSSIPFTIGPSVQFGLTNILKKDSDKRYVLFGGIKMQMLLPGKKNK